MITIRKRLTIVALVTKITNVIYVPKIDDNRTISETISVFA